METLPAFSPIATSVIHSPRKKSEEDGNCSGEEHSITLQLTRMSSILRKAEKGRL